MNASVIVTRTVAGIIALIAASGSYASQVALLHSNGVAGWFAFAAPLTVDLLALTASVYRNGANADVTGRRVALYALILAGSMSVSANVAEGHNLVTRLLGCWCVVAYLIAELLASKAGARKPAAEVAREAADAAALAQATAALALAQTQADADFARRSEAAKEGAAKRKANAAKANRSRKARTPAAPAAATWTMTADDAAEVFATAPMSPAVV